MSIPKAPTEPVAQLQWLVDRAAISDLLIEFARALDDRDWQAYGNLYAQDGQLEVSPTVQHTGRVGMPEYVRASLSGYAGGTHHLSTNHAIHIDGDSATTRSYLIASHVFDNPTKHADGAGWYDCSLVRTDEGWRLAKVALTIRYVSGEPIAH